jgi:hypothetical protein
VTHPRRVSQAEPGRSDDPQCSQSKRHRPD